MAKSNKEIKLPINVKGLLTHKNAFIEFFERQGIQVNISMYPYEILRFKGSNGLSVIGKNKKESLRWNESAKKSWELFIKRNSNKKVAKQRKNKKERKEQIDFLIKRDGKKCIYCSKELQTEEITIEHFFPIDAGGGNHYSNLGLSCQRCNCRVGSSPIASKINYAVEKRSCKEVS